MSLKNGLRTVICNQIFKSNLMCLFLLLYKLIHYTKNIPLGKLCRFRSLFLITIEHVNVYDWSLKPFGQDYDLVSCTT